jgi:hypothetical protein
MKWNEGKVIVKCGCITLCHYVFHYCYCLVYSMLNFLLIFIYIIVVVIVFAFYSLCSVSFIVRVVLCVMFCLSMVCNFL